ncbi:MAG: type I phosphomannose isomerase catalytic subunit [Verrucomicrobiota bacterium]
MSHRLYPKLVATANLYPLKFTPILVERIWGGTALARYGKPIPPGKRIGESWEISDRDKEQSVVANGTLKGQTLRQVITQWGDRLLGSNCRGTSRFPLLIKMLDARERLSLQVHPPAALAPQLHGEPKTEMWYVLQAEPDAHLIAGLRRGVTRQQFEQAIAQGGAAFQKCFHRFPIHAGESLFVPSGRLHAIDAGLVIVEIQQNSDTTYRVYDWDRGRELQVRESLASIDFNDFEPPTTPLPISCEHFRVEKLTVAGSTAGNCDGSSFHIFAGLTGTLSVNGESLARGEFLLLPAALGIYTITGNGSALRTDVPYN